MSTPYNFTVEIQEAGGKVCQQALTITVETSCGLGLNWISDASILCRLRIKGYFDGIFGIGAPCLACPPPPVCVPWDGTFSVRTVAGFPTPVVYNSAALGFNSISGRQLSANTPTISYNQVTLKWGLTINCSTGVPGNIWSGHKPVTTEPIGIYTPDVFDAFGIGNIEIEGYLPP